MRRQCSEAETTLPLRNILGCQRGGNLFRWLRQDGRSAKCFPRICVVVPLDMKSKRSYLPVIYGHCNDHDGVQDCAEGLYPKFDCIRKINFDIDTLATVQCSSKADSKTLQGKDS